MVFLKVLFIIQNKGKKATAQIIFWETNNHAHTLSEDKELSLAQDYLNINQSPQWLISRDYLKELAAVLLCLR